MLRAGATHEQIIDALAEEKSAMYKRIVELELIAPKRFGDLIWQCPVELIPESGRPPNHDEN